MAVSFKEIQSLLNSHLNTLDPKPRIMWENQWFEVDDNELYLRVHLLPAESLIKELGSNPLSLERGIYQVDVVGIRGEGWGDVYDWVDKICNLFYKGLVISDSSSDISVRIEKSYPSPGFYDGGRYVVPVNISYHVFMK